MECDLVSVSISRIVFIRWHASLAKEVRDTFSFVCAIDSAVAGKYCWRSHKSTYSTLTQLFRCFLDSCGTFDCRSEWGITNRFFGGHTIDGTTLSADKPQSNVTRIPQATRRILLDSSLEHFRRFFVRCALFAFAYRFTLHIVQRIH